MRIKQLDVVHPVRYGTGAPKDRHLSSEKLSLEFLPEDEVVEFREMDGESGPFRTVLLVPRDNIASMIPE